ncbi:MAG: copper resistance protein CopC/CopD, partial [Nocardioidaceae bacterium]|nr:copper resistance protein CopC/CopD [Nocardioidaceae bacterium]
SVNLVRDGIRLVDDVGATVPTPDPTADGRTVVWRMPTNLPDGPYAVTWRVISSDGHPVGGAFSFGVGAAAGAVPSSAAVSTPTSATAPWPVVAVRLVGYLAFALLAGVVAFVLWCSPGSGSDPSLQRLTRIGLLGGLAAAFAGLLVQGPYAEGVSMSRLLDITLLRDTLTTPFGTAMMWRFVLYVGLAVLAWKLPLVQDRPARWLVPGGVVALAVAIAAAGHGAASGRLVDLGVDATHALTAGIWVGGLVALVTLGRSVEQRAVHQFSMLAMTSVLVLVATGTVNALREVDALAQLWETRYGVFLLVKLGLVATALGGAWFSRRRVQEHRVPARSVRFEAGVLGAVLAVTAVLSMTTPPPKTDPAALAPVNRPANAAVQMTLGDQGSAGLAVLPANTKGSSLHVLLSGPDGRPLTASRVSLRVSNPRRGLEPATVPLSLRNGVWTGDFRFLVPGVWKAVLTVQVPGESAVVTGGDVVIFR